MHTAHSLISAHALTFELDLGHPETLVHVQAIHVVLNTNLFCLLEFIHPELGPLKAGLVCEVCGQLTGQVHVPGQLAGQLTGQLTGQGTGQGTQRTAPQLSTSMHK